MIGRQHFLLKLSVVLTIAVALTVLTMLSGALAQSTQKKVKRIEEVTVREGASQVRVKQGFEWVRQGENNFTVRSLTAGTTQQTPSVEGQFQCKCVNREKLLRRGTCVAVITGSSLLCKICPDCKCESCELHLK